MDHKQLTGRIYSKLIEKTKTDLRNWDDLDMWMLAESIEEAVSQSLHELNEKQQMVLDTLKKNANQGLDELIVGGVAYLNNEEIDAIELSSQHDLYEVFAAFAEWGLSQEVAE